MLVRDLLPEDEREVVTFTDAEWKRMMQDPVYFGYACQSGHACREDDLDYIHNGCPKCNLIGDLADDMYALGEPNALTLKEFDRWVKSLEDFPLIRCGNCKGTHVGVGGVRRCYQGGKFIHA